MRLLFLTILTLTISLSNAQSVLGKWKTIDDSSGATRSIVEITENGGKIFGKVIKLFPKPSEDPDPVCDNCDSVDPRFKKKIIGMEIIRNMTKTGNEYSGGDILDPENGKVYKSKIWVEGKDLKVRGYWGPFYRTQTWQQAE